MNEKAFDDLYQEFVETGYKNSKEAFKELMSTNPEAFLDGYQSFTETGYNGSQSDFASLIGVIDPTLNNKYYQKKIKHKTSKINLLKAQTWVLVSEKDPLMGLNKVPDAYYVSRKFNENGKGVEFISTDTKKNPPKSSNFTYSLVGNDLTITQDDGYVLNEELREISEDKLVLNIKKFQNERTYKAKDKMNDLTAGQDSNNGRITKKSGKYSISIPKDWLFSESDPGTEFIVTSPLSTKPNDMFAENVNLMVQMVGNMSMDEYMNLTKKQFAGMNVSDLRIVDVKGKKELEYSFKYGGSELKVLQYLWLENRKAYILTYTDMKAAFEMHIKLGRRILNSFKF